MFAPKAVLPLAKSAATPVSRPAPRRSAMEGRGLVEGVINDPGEALDALTRSHFQSTFGRDFASVRVHTDARAATSAAAVSARAYTVGHHIVFGRGQYEPGTPKGRYLLGHELAHVVQQSRRGPAASHPRDPGIESAANHAAQEAARGSSASVSGSSEVGIACKSLFEAFSAGSYSWNFLKLALEHDRPVQTVVDDVNALNAAEREQAIKDITQARIERDRHRTDLKRRRTTQTDPALQAVFDPMQAEDTRVLDRMDAVLDGLFVIVAGSETKASLRANTTAPSAAQKPLIESALKPDLRGAAQSFKECPSGPCVPGAPGSYLAELRTIMPPLIERLWQKQVPHRGKAEHDDPSKVHSISELERIGNASKRETDAVFGAYKKGPVLKADTRTSRGNIHDLWQDTETRLKSISAGEKREMARELVFYFFRSNGELRALNASHYADPKFTKENAAINEEAKDQEKIVTESTATPEAVKKLNEIDRGWPGSEGDGQINAQLFRRPDTPTGTLAGLNVPDRDFLWDTFQILIHEYLHTLADPAYNRFAESFGEKSSQFNTLVEGVDSLLDEVVWSVVEPRVADPGLRAEIEGPVYAALPAFTIKPASRRRYDSYVEAVKLVNVVGIRNLYAAYFLGDVSKIKP